MVGMDFGQFLTQRRQAGTTEPMGPQMARKPIPVPGGYQEALMRKEQAQQKPIAQRFAEFQAAREAARQGRQTAAPPVAPPVIRPDSAAPMIPIRTLTTQPQVPAGMTAAPMTNIRGLLRR